MKPDPLMLGGIALLTPYGVVLMPTGVAPTLMADGIGWVLEKEVGQ